MKKVKRVAGSSAGAICAGLLAVGCSAQEIADVFKCDIKWLFHGKLHLPSSIKCDIKWLFHGKLHLPTSISQVQHTYITCNYCTFVGCQLVAVYVAAEVGRSMLSRMSSGRSFFFSLLSIIYIYG